MKILLIEPYYGGSHRAWADGYKRSSDHDITLLTMPAQFWKWRMQGAAVTLARLFDEQGLCPDVILASDMFDLSTFLALTRNDTRSIPTALYFHETQLTYPQNSRQKHGWQYGFINYASALAADTVFFNSNYHHDIFFKTLPNMLKHFADYNELQTVPQLQEKSSVLPLGMDLQRFDPHYVEKTERSAPLILWNHRWEADKNPTSFFSALYRLIEQGIDFRVAITGENFRREPTEFIEAKERLGERVLQYGYMPSFADYARLLWQADYVVSTSNQDFFGGSMAEAIYCGCVPLLPQRLNYPYLIPEQAHKACLYKGSGLFHTLLRHIVKNEIVDTGLLQSHVAQYDWSVMTQMYDEIIDNLSV